jgi:hypothetical protein
VNWCDDEILGDLDVGRPEVPLQGRPRLLRQDVASLGRDDLSLHDRALREQTLAVNRALPHFRAR